MILLLPFVWDSPFMMLLIVLGHVGLQYAQPIDWVQVPFLLITLPLPPRVPITLYGTTVCTVFVMGAWPSPRFAARARCCVRRQPVPLLGTLTRIPDDIWLVTDPRVRDCGCCNLAVTQVWLRYNLGWAAVFGCLVRIP